MAANTINQNIADIFVQLQNNYDGACMESFYAFCNDLESLRKNFVKAGDKLEQNKIDSLAPMMSDLKEYVGEE